MVNEEKAPVFATRLEGAAVVGAATSVCPRDTGSIGGGGVRVCSTEELFLRALSRALSVVVLQLVVEFAAPTVHPSAWALKQMCAAHPWVVPMQRAFPEMPFSYFALKHKTVGLGWCWKCDSCIVARLRRIRRKFDDQFERVTWDDYLDSDDGGAN